MINLLLVVLVVVVVVAAPHIETGWGVQITWELQEYSHGKILNIALFFFFSFLFLNDRFRSTGHRDMTAAARLVSPMDMSIRVDLRAANFPTNKDVHHCPAVSIRSICASSSLVPEPFAILSCTQVLVGTPTSRPVYALYTKSNVE